MSKTTKIKLADANVEQLREFATIQGIQLTGTENSVTLRARISATWQGDEITVTEPEPIPTAGPRGEKIDAAPAEPGNKWDEMVEIFIDKTDDPEGSQPVWVSVNGRGQWIERGKQSKIKRKYAHVLENAERIVYDQGPSENGVPGPLIPRSVKAYPWRYVTRSDAA
jgi:hypothetical protein